MTFEEITYFRLSNQQIIDTNFKTPQEIVAHLGAVQAQDYPMAKWAIGLRLPNCTNELIEKAIDEAQIIRTHILRPTWHFVSADDIRWMLQLTAPQILKVVSSMNKKLELTSEILKKSNDLITKMLIGKQLTRQEIMSELKKSGIPTDDFRASHLMFQAELEAIVCNGSMRGKQLTYALLDERVPPANSLTKEEALAKLAERYFKSHNPATLTDFAWWSGLTIGDARLGLDLVKSNFLSEKIDEQVYWFSDTSISKNFNREKVYLLPAFDEFMVSYKDRSASLSPTDFKQAITNNGIFKPIIVVDGKVIGIWKRAIKKDSVIIEAQFFNPSQKINPEKLTQASKSFSEFLNLKTIIK